MKSPQPAAAPDPVATANAQAAMNNIAEYGRKATNPNTTPSQRGLFDLGQAQRNLVQVLPALRSSWRL